MSNFFTLAGLLYTSYFFYGKFKALIQAEKNHKSWVIESNQQHRYLRKYR